jgi:hypothetical protein
MDETVIYFLLMPDKALTLKGKTCVRGIKSKEWSTKLLCCHDNSNEKLKLLVVGEPSGSHPIKGKHQIENRRLALLNCHRLFGPLSPVP